MARLVVCSRFVSYALLGRLDQAVEEARQELMLAEEYQRQQLSIVRSLEYFVRLHLERRRSESD